MDIFPVFDPITEEFLYHKPRHKVHREGDWHRGIQANIIRKNALGTFDILVQERSDIVDIAACKLDQSLATQMIDKDGLNEKIALKRGLRDELGITHYRTKRLAKNLRIVKTYAQQPAMLNRELISLYIVLVPEGDEVRAFSPKVKRIFWMEWSAFLQFFHDHKKEFTKTARFYFLHPSLIHEIALMSHTLIQRQSGRQAKTAMLHIDRANAETRTYEGDIASCFEEAGELP